MKNEKFSQIEKSVKAFTEITEKENTDRLLKVYKREEAGD